MTGNISYLTDFKKFDEGYVAFGEGAKGDSKLPMTFWAEAVNTACFVHHKVLVVKPYFKTPYELFRGRTSALSFIRPFECHVTILNTLDYLGKFDGKLDEGFFVGYSTNSKAFRVYNTRTRKVEENLHIKFLENKPLIASDGPKWLFDIDTLTESMNYVSVITGTTSNDFAGKGASFDVGQSSMETRPNQDYVLMPLWNDNLLFDSSLKALDGDNQDNDSLNTKSEIDNQERPNAEHSTKDINTVAPSINTVCQPPWFEDPDYPDKVNKVEKALYGLHQAPRAWYETLANYLLGNGFRKGKIDQTLFIKRQKDDILLVQVYINDIIFGSTKKELCSKFERSDGIFISQYKYVDEILRKFKCEDVKPANTSMDKEKALLKDSDGDDVDVYLYRAVIDSSSEEEASLDHEDSPKQGRMIEEMDKDENVNLVKSSEQREAHETAEHRMDLKIKMLFDNTMGSIRRFVPMESKGQAGEGSSKEGDVGYYEIHREDGSYKTYIFFSEMLNDFDSEDLIVLYKLFNEKYASTRPGFDDLMLWGDMKIMFEPNGEVGIHMLVEKKYPLHQDTLRRMLQWKLHVNYNVTEMAYELLRFIRSQINQ
nr:putative ribonuclease H-like domain-containing protein [Tanacetum cinerariifolium]